MKILVVVSGGLSETLQATPLLRALRTGLPDAVITLAAPPAAEGLRDCLPTVDELVTWRGLGAHGGLGGALAVGWQLRRRRCDMAVVCSTRAREGALVYAAGIARRVGVSTWRTAPFFSEHERSGRNENNGSAWLRLAAVIGVAPALHPDGIAPGDAARHRIDGLLTTAGVDRERILVAIAPGTGGGDAPHCDPATLAWDPQRYAHLANQMAYRHGAAVVLVGPESDRGAINTALMDLGAPHLDLCGELDIAESAALMARCDLLVCGDSPLLHLAATMGTPAVGLFGPTDGRRRGPFGTSHRVIQALPESADLLGRRHARMGRIRVEDVLAGIETTL